MMSLLFERMSTFAFIVLAIVFYTFGERLSHRIGLVPSFFFSIALAACSIVLVLASD